MPNLETDLQKPGLYAVDGDLIAKLARRGGGQADVTLVECVLPGPDGLAILEVARKENVRILIAVGVVDDRQRRGSRIDSDYDLAKPFAIAEVIAGLEALSRRPGDNRETLLRVGPLELDLLERNARRDGRSIDLLPREFRLLDYMMRRPSQLLTRAMLFEEVWHYKFLPQSNLVDVHMGKLRRKVDAPDRPPMIQLVRGEGFVLRAPSEQPNSF